MIFFVLTYSVHAAAPSLVVRKHFHPALVDLTKRYQESLDLTSQDLPEGLADPVTSLAPLNAWWQRYGLRPAHMDHPQIARLAPNRLHNDMMPLFEQLGLITPLLPTRSFYDVIAVFGGSPQDTRERFYHLHRLWQQGIRSKKIIYINGHRKLYTEELTAHGLDVDHKLTPSQPDWKPPQVLPTLQHEMAALIFKQLFHPISDQGIYEKFTILTISPPKGKKRANTADTVSALFAQEGDKSYLFISNQPYGPYQGAIVDYIKHKVGKETLITETTACGLEREVTTMPFLDTIARRIYTEYQLELLQKKNI